ncbi:MAG TPA: phosphate ABC transporter permease subunit PstC [Candidatus Kapabacteria bacterium]|nr:phosphate ABC transporter permease subunit PstC [Candidatus Kapabacteria bacterium]
MSDQHAENRSPEAPASRAPATKEERRLLLTTKQRRLGERLAELGIFSVATVSILAIFLIFVFVFRESAPIFFGSDEPTPVADTTRAGDTAATIATPEGIDRGDYPTLDHDAPVKLSYLWYDVWQPNSDHPAYGIFPIIIGTLKTTFVALAIATPLGILAALYTAFFAPLWVREYLKPIIELLAAFPSVVVGFFCLMTVASVVQAVFGNSIRLNAVVGGIGLSIAVIPIIFTITDDALRAVPRSLREAALALGASEWQAAYQVMLPAATPGIVAAVLLGLGRAFGETMIALMATGNGQVMSWDLFVSVRTFAATIGAEMGEVVTGSPHYQVLFFLGVLLFTFSFVINFVTEFYVKKRLIKRFRGGE